MLTSDFFIKDFQSLVHDHAFYRYLIAVSGGVDSMVLADLFLKNKIYFEVAHINYKLRGDDSDLDKNLVENFCKKNNIQFHVYDASEKDAKPSGSIQNWARKLRYHFFREIQNERNLDFLVTAHHLNDQIETFIINLSRATGLDGLSGIPKNENGILRPLLNFSKEEIYEYAKQNKVEFREDASNYENYYLRNQIRNNIVPELLKLNDNFLENFSKSLHLINQSKNLIKHQIPLIQKKITLKYDNEQIILDKKLLEKQPKLVQYEILEPFGFQDEKEISKIFAAETGKSFYSKKFQLLINRDEIIITQKATKFSNEKVIICGNKKQIKNRNNEIIISDFYITKDFKTPIIWQIDADKIVFPLMMRNMEEGDLIFPIGMIGKKKISKFFKDEKFSILAKQKIKLLCDAENNVLGVIPSRQDRRFLANPESTNILKIIFDKKSL